jgi:hypothetical protein
MILLMSGLVLAEIRYDKSRARAAAATPTAATASPASNPYAGILPDTPAADSGIDQVPGGG